MKFKLIAFCFLTVLLAIGCAKEEHQLHEEVMEVNVQTNDDAAKRLWGPIFASSNCSTAFYATGGSGTVVITNSSGTVVATINVPGTAYPTLQTNQNYTVNAPLGVTVSYCSCGENYGTLSGCTTFTTSSNPAYYSTCAF